MLLVGSRLCPPARPNIRRFMPLSHMSGASAMHIAPHAATQLDGPTTVSYVGSGVSRRRAVTPTAQHLYYAAPQPSKAANRDIPVVCRSLFCWRAHRPPLPCRLQIRYGACFRDVVHCVISAVLRTRQTGNSMSSTAHTLQSPPLPWMAWLRRLVLSRTCAG